MKSTETKKKQTKIMLVNVTGSATNEWCLFELKKAGFPQGSIIIDPYFDERNNSFTWSSGTNDCVAYLGETCEII